MDKTEQGHSPESGDEVLAFPSAKRIDRQAAEWMAKLDAEAPTETERAAFKVWVNERPEHRQAFEAMIDLWGDMNVLSEVVLPRELREHSHNSKQAQNDPAEPALSLWRRGGMVAACAVLLFAVWLLPNLGHEQSQLFVTGIGEQRRIELADGSQVLLNTNSRLQVRYSDTRRHLNLQQGEAHFEVAHNPARPFEVYAGSGLVRALGTAFSVHINKLLVEVTVTEGVVELDSADKPSREPPEITATRVDGKTQDKGEGVQTFEVGLQVSAGNVLTYDRAVLDQVELMLVKEIEKQLSWHQGLLVFEEEPLDKVVAEIGRYTELKIVIPERETRQMKVGGLFKVGDTEALFEALREGFDIHAEVASENVVYLMSGKNR